MTVSKELLEILVCPLCKQQVAEVESGAYLDCNVCQLRFEVRTGIPVMLVDESEKIATVNQKN